MSVPDDEQPTERIGGTGPTRALGEEPGQWRFGPGQPLDGGRYVLRRRLGFGGMSTVWLATDRKLDRPVAIKVLADTLASDGDYLRRFEREARVAAGLVHPNLVSIYDFDAGERPYLVMEYVEGGDLAERIKAGEVPDPDRLARDLLSALELIHSAGVTHRDIKPKNVLIGADGNALLTDFGIARPSDATQLTRTGLVLGTSSYIAPEVLAGASADERSDLYSAGVTLAEAAEHGSPSEELLALIDRLRAADPAQRPVSAAAAAEALRSRRRSPTPAATVPVQPPPGTTPPHSVGRRLAPLAIAALAALVALILIFAGGDDNPVDSGESGGGGELTDQRAGEKGEQTTTGAEPAPAPTGAELNDEGFSLIQQGKPAEAVPILEQAVEALEGSGDITYAYALYNLGLALRLAGRPEEAIPVLEARLEIPNQTGEVQEQLDLAYAEAGVDSGGVEAEGGDKDLPPGQKKKLKKSDD